MAPFLGDTVHLYQLRSGADRNLVRRGRIAVPQTKS